MVKTAISYNILRVFEGPRHLGEFVLRGGLTANRMLGDVALLYYSKI